MTKTVLCLLALLTAPLLCAQTLYAVTATNNIYSINEDYSVNYISTAIFPNNFFGDIAISPSGEMYGIAANIIYQIDILSGEVTYIAQLPPDTYNTLVCSSEYELYTINLSEMTLYKYNLLTYETTNIAYLGLTTAGDLTFFKGNIIATGYNPDGAGVIKAYNPETGALKDIFCDSSLSFFWGLTSNYTDCGYETIFGSDIYSQLFSIDFESQALVPIPIQFPEESQFVGLASTTEYLGSLCEPQELENINCYLSADYNPKEEIIIYPNPVMDMLYFKNTTPIKKVTVYDVGGKVVKTVAEEQVSKINISTLEKGMYLVKIEGENSSAMRKVIKR